MSLTLSKIFKECSKRAKTILCLLVCMVIVIASLPVILHSSAEISETVLCNDDFNRDDADMAGNGWLDITAGNSKISDNALVLKASSIEEALLNRIQRPQSEASIEQKVSVEFTIEDLVDGKRPLVWLRSQNSEKEGVAGYFLTWEGNGSGYGNYIRIYKRTSDSTSFTKVAEQMYNINFTNGNWTGTLRFDVDVLGTYPTRFNVTAYAKSLNWEQSWSIGSDSTPELQNSGTVGISAFTVSGEAAEMTFDNFKYSAADIKRTVSFVNDKFSRADSDTVGNGWSEYPNSDYFKIKNNQLEMVIPENTKTLIRLQRTTSEKALNQNVSLKVSAEEMAAKKFPVLWLRVQNDAADENTQGYYFTFDGNYLIFGISTADGTHKQLANNWFQPALANYNSITFGVSAISSGKSTTLSVSADCDLKTGNDWVKEYSIIDSTPELQQEGTVAISGFESSSLTKPTMVVDNFAYATDIDGTPLYEKIQEAEAAVKSGIGYTKESLELIKQEIEKAYAVVNNIRNVSQADINDAMASLQAAIDTVLPLPKITLIKINGNVPKEVTYNSYNITVGKDVKSLDFEVVTEKTDDILTVTRDKTGVTGVTQEFTADNSETYTVTIVSATQAEAVSTFRVAVYRSEATFVEFTDDFERKDGILGNGWIEETDGIAGIDDGNMSISCGGVTSTEDAYKNRVIRPFEEGTVDQYITADVPVETLRNGAIPRFWLRLQDDGDDNPLNNDGYYVMANFRDGISIHKRVNGVDTRIYKIMHMPNLSLYEGVFHFEILIRGTDTTEFRVRIKNNAPSAGGELWRVSEIYKDSDNPITTAGTVGISYSSTTANYLVSDFYYCDYKQPDYMLHVIGKNNMGYFGQWLDLDPKETYVYSYEVHAANDTGATAIMPTLQYANEGSNPYDFFYFEDYNRDMVKQTFKGTFKIPVDAMKQLDGNVAVRVGFMTGRNGSEAYIHNMKVYKLSDTNQTNLFQNSDFSRGLYGWMANGKTFEPIISESTFASSTSDVELEKYNPSLFEEDSGAKNEVYYPDHKGDFMFYSNGANAWCDLTQRVDVKPGETYLFSYYYNFISNNWIQPFCDFYTGDTEQSKRLTFEYKQTDSQNCIITCEFIVPTNSKINPDGTTTITIGINFGEKGSMAYFYKPMLYVKSDPNKTNLFYNADFKRGFEGWSCMGMTTWAVSTPDIYFGPIYNDIELLPVDLSYFNLGDVASDGEWWREFYPNGLPGSEEATEDDKKEDNDSPKDEEPDKDFDDDIDLEPDIEDDDKDLSDTELPDSSDSNEPDSSNGEKPQNTDTDVKPEKNSGSGLIIAIAATASAVIIAAGIVIILIVRKKRKA